MSNIKEFIKTAKENINNEVFANCEFGQIGLKYGCGEFRLHHNAQNYNRLSEYEVEKILQMKMN